MNFQKEIAGVTISNWTFDPSTLSSTTLSIDTGLTVTESTLLSIANTTTHEWYYITPGDSTNVVTDITSNVITMDLSGLSGTPSSTDSFQIIVAVEDTTKDSSLNVVKTAEQVNDRDPANSWLALVDNATSISIGSYYYPIYWNAGHRSIDLSIDSISGTNLVLTAWVTGNSDASVTTDPESDEDWKNWSLAILGGVNINETSSKIYRSLPLDVEFAPSIILFKLVVSEVSDGALNIRYRTK